ncbi:MAG: hypothetical protein PHQ95_03235 [Candidatus Gracilibacteria bacterium]|nr:hypothetical protein [Candidatus Gracilibacteria bacterium]
MKTNQLILGIITIGILMSIAFLTFSFLPEQKPEKATKQVSTEDIGNNLEKSNLKNPSYEGIIGFIDEHITEIIGAYSSKKAVNGKWFADGFGFTSANHVYVDFEDGHFLFRALLECSYENSIISCTPLAILEKQKEEEWITIEGTDTQKDFPIIYTWTKDYEWQR